MGGLDTSVSQQQAPPSIFVPPTPSPPQPPPCRCRPRRVQLQVYDQWPLHLPGLETSALVPPLLGTFYAALGPLAWAADRALGGDPSTAAARARASSPAFVAACYGLCAAGLALSAELYRRGVSYPVIGAAMAAVCVGGWAAVDGTRQGLALCALSAAAGPAAELVLMAAWNTWHYSRPDVAGCFVSWVPLCYFFYALLPVNLSRHLRHRFRR